MCATHLPQNWANRAKVVSVTEMKECPRALPRYVKALGVVGVELSSYYAKVAERNVRGGPTQDDFVLAGPEAWS